MCAAGALRSSSLQWFTFSIVSSGSRPFMIQLYMDWLGSSLFKLHSSWHHVSCNDCRLCSVWVCSVVIVPDLFDSCLWYCRFTGFKKHLVALLKKRQQATQIRVSRHLYRPQNVLETASHTPLSLSTFLQPGQRLIIRCFSWLFTTVWISK